MMKIPSKFAMYMPELHMYKGIIKEDSLEERTRKERNASKEYVAAQQGNPPEPEKPPLITHYNTPAEPAPAEPAPAASEPSDTAVAEPAPTNNTPPKDSSAPDTGPKTFLTKHASEYTAMDVFMANQARNLMQTAQGLFSYDKTHPEHVPASSLSTGNQI